MPAERPGSVPGRSSCVPCGRSRRLSSPGDAPMHHSPTRSLSTIEPGGFVDADPRAVIRKDYSGRHVKERVGGGGAKVESACDKGSSLICGNGGYDARPSGSSRCRPRPIYMQKTVLLGVKPVPEIVPVAWSKEMSGSCPALAAYLVHCPSFLNGFPLASV